MAGLCRLVLFGASGLGKDTYDMVCEINKVSPEYEVVAFADDDDAKEGGYLVGIPVRSREWLIENRGNCVCCCTIGNPALRESIMMSLMPTGIKFVTLVHPTAHISIGATVGEGTIIGRLSLIGAEARIGSGVFIDGSVNIGHDAVLDDYVTCFPRVQLSGGVRIGKGASMGGSSFVLPGKKIGAGAVVAPGSIVFGNVKANWHVMGNPAKKIDL